MNLEEHPNRKEELASCLTFAFASSFKDYSTESLTLVREADISFALVRRSGYSRECFEECDHHQTKGGLCCVSHSGG